MDERPPRPPVGEEPDAPGRVRPAGEVVEHDVEPQPRRDAVDGRVPHRDDDEVVVGERPRAPPPPAPSTRRRPSAGGAARSRRAGRPFRTRRTSSTTTRRRSASTPASFAARATPKRRVEVDVVRPLLVEVADRVVRQRRQVDDRVEPLEVRRRHVADVASHASGSRARSVAEVASLVEARVEPDDVVARARRAPARAPSRCSRGCR